jgi:starvation-inducible DNA-binding protein
MPAAAVAKRRAMTPPESLGQKARANVGAILSHALAEELLLSTTTRDFYAKFPAFHSLHKLFADQYRQLEQWLAELGNRTSVFGATPQPNPEELAVARCLALRGKVPERAMVGELLSLHEELAKRLQDDIRTCRHELGDQSTAEVLRHLVEFHETTAWMLRTVLEGSALTPPHSP